MHHHALFLGEKEEHASER